MELAAPGIKKEYCRVAINDEGRSAEGRLQGKNLTIAIENKQEHKHEDSHRHYLRREFFASKATKVERSYSNYVGVCDVYVRCYVRCLKWSFPLFKGVSEYSY